MDDQLLKILRCPSSGNKLIPIDADSVKNVDLDKGLSDQSDMRAALSNGFDKSAAQRLERPMGW